MFSDLNKMALNWIISNLKPFIELLEISLDLMKTKKPSSELIFINLFLNCNDNFKEDVYTNIKYLSKYLDEKIIFKNIDRYNLGHLLLSIYFNKNVLLTKKCKENINLLNYREQMEIIMYYNISKNINKYLLNEHICRNSIIYQQLSYQNFDLSDIYEFTHEIMYFTGLGRWKSDLILDKYSYICFTINKLLERTILEENEDLILELILCSKLVKSNLECDLLVKSFNIISKFVRNNINFKLSISNIEKSVEIYHPFLVLSLI